METPGCLARKQRMSGGGDVKDVVFPCGQTIGPDGDTIHLYYGAGGLVRSAGHRKSSQTSVVAGHKVKRERCRDILALRGPIDMNSARLSWPPAGPRFSWIRRKCPLCSSIEFKSAEPERLEFSSVCSL